MPALWAPLIAVIFATPAAALAVAGGVAALPIIIHLLNRKRFLVVNWAAMRFLLAAQRKNVRRLQLEQWILLAVRMLIGILIVAAMASLQDWARPFWQAVAPRVISSNAPLGRAHRIIVVDGSFTMATRLGDESTRFDQAKIQARQVVEQAASGDGFTLIFLTSPVQVIVQGPADDRKKVIEEIDELKLPHGSADVDGGIRVIADILNRPIDKYARREVTFITDLRRSGWPLHASTKQLDARVDALTATPSALQDTWQAITRSASIVFIDVARQDVDNLAVTELTIGDSLPTVGEDVRISVTLNNHGKEARKKVPVVLRIGKSPLPGEKLQLVEYAQRDVDVAAQGSSNIVFVLDKRNRFREAGSYVVNVKAGDDLLGLDDVRSLVVKVRDSIPVLIVEGKISSEPLDLPSEWVRRALKPGRADSDSFIKPTIVSFSQLADRFRVDLTKYDCVFLCDLPSISGNEADRLEAHLQRGGSIIMSLGPNAARNIDDYNRVLFNNGKGILPVKLLGVKHAEGDGYFNLFAGEEAFKQLPLSAYRDDKERAALTIPQFHQYIRVDASMERNARRIFSFLPAESLKSNVPRPDDSANLDPAVLDIPRYRGRVVLYTSTFNPERIGRNQFWSTWPPHPTFLPFLHETVRYSVARNDRRNLIVGDTIAEYLPIALTGLKAKLSRMDGDAETALASLDVISRDETAVATFNNIEATGIYRLSIGANPDALFAVNVPVTAPAGGAESDLHRLNQGDLQATAPEADIQVVGDSSEVQVHPGRSHGDDKTFYAEKQEQRGTSAARFLLFLALLFILVEVYLAWRLGSARSSPIERQGTSTVRRRLALNVLWIVPTLACFIVLAAVAHAAITNDFLGFLPGAWRQSLETSLGVPAAAAGEGTRWRLEAMAYVTGTGQTDVWLVSAFIFLAIAYVCYIYSLERTGIAPSARRRLLHDPRCAAALLRIQLILITSVILLPQLRLAFKRESWPDVVIIFDDSRSMAIVEQYHDPILSEKIEELKAAWRELARPRIAATVKRIEEARSTLAGNPMSADTDPLTTELSRLEKKLEDLKTPHRLNLIKALLASSSQDWLKTLLVERQMRVHLYRASAQTTRFATLSDPAEAARMLEEIIDLLPEGDESRFGDATTTVLKSFRGSSLCGIILFTDGQRTKGEEITQASLLAEKRGVPLFLVGVGDNQPKPDVAIGNLKAEQFINIKDHLFFEFTLTANGPGMPKAVPVNLFEVIDGKRVRRNEAVKFPTNSKVRLSVTPDSPGDKRYVIEVPAQPGESNLKNNVLEHDVHVADVKRLRVLLIEGTPRYEFRFIKTLLERESEKVQDNKAIDLNVYLMSGSKDYFKQDKSAIAEFPGWETLKTYDVVILGDVDPKQFPREQAQFKLLADFVRERGGGLLMIAGQHFAPHAYAGTDLADVLPVTTEGIQQAPQPRAEDPPITTSYLPRLNSVGLNHPIFRFVADETENAAVWSKLKPMMWYAKGYRRKLSAEVLAIHPDKLAEPGPGTGKDELHPLVLQQFVGAGRVMFFGFDETWRWRFRQEEQRFNQFWIQTIRSLARQRVGRIELHLDQQVYRRDDPIRITVRFPEDAPAPSKDDIVRVNLERRPLATSPAKAPDDTRVETIQLNRKDGTRATYEALLTRTPEGEYRFLLASPIMQGTIPKADATVLAPKGELEDTTLNEAPLKQAALDSHGGYYTLGNAHQLLDDLPDGLRVELDQPCPPLPLWNHPLMFALVFSLLLGEWILRKRARLL